MPSQQPGKFANDIQRFAEKRNLDLAPKVKPRQGFLSNLMGEFSGDFVATAAVYFAEHPEHINKVEWLREALYKQFKGYFEQSAMKRALAENGLKNETELAAAEARVQERVLELRDQLVYFETDGQARLAIMYFTGTFIGNVMFRFLLNRTKAGMGGEEEKIPLDELLWPKIATVVGTFYGIGWLRNSFSGFFDKLDYGIGLIASDGPKMLIESLLPEDKAQSMITSLYGEKRDGTEGVKLGVKASRKAKDVELKRMAGDALVSLISSGREAEANDGNKVNILSSREAVALLLQRARTLYTENGSLNREAFLADFFKDTDGNFLAGAEGEYTKLMQLMAPYGDDGLVDILSGYVNKETGRRPEAIRFLGKATNAVVARGEFSIEGQDESVRIADESGRISDAMLKEAGLDVEYDMYTAVGFIKKADQIMGRYTEYGKLTDILDHLVNIDFEGAGIDEVKALLSYPSDENVKTLLWPLLVDAQSTPGATDRLKALFNRAPAEQMTFVTEGGSFNEERLEKLKTLVSYYRDTKQALTDHEEPGREALRRFFETTEGSADAGLPAAERDFSYLGKIGQALKDQLVFSEAIHDLESDHDESIINDRARDRVIVNNQKSLGQFLDFLLIIDGPSAWVVGKFTNFLYNRRVERGLKQLQQFSNRIEDANDPLSLQTLEQLEQKQQAGDLDRQDKRMLKDMRKQFDKAAESLQEITKRYQELTTKAQEKGLSDKEQVQLNRANSMLDLMGPSYRAQVQAQMKQSTSDTQSTTGAPAQESAATLSLMGLDSSRSSADAARPVTQPDERYTPSVTNVQSEAENRQASQSPAYPNPTLPNRPVEPRKKALEQQAKAERIQDSPTSSQTVAGRPLSGDTGSFVSEQQITELAQATEQNLDQGRFALSQLATESSAQPGIMDGK